MLTELTVENLAIIERTQVTFGAGFTVLTGETGAGKSLLIDALQLLLGARADTDLIRTGSQRLSVTGCFAGEEVTREVLASGRSQAKIDGKSASVTVLREFARTRVDLCGQHDHQSLLLPELHLGYLDSYVGIPIQAALVEYQAALAEFREADRRLRDLRRGVQDREQRLDLLRYQIQEIESAAPVVGEYEEHEQRLSQLQHAERLAEATQTALRVLTDEEGAAIDRVGQAFKMMDAVVRYDESLAELSDSLASAQSVLNDLAYRLRDYAESLEADPQEANTRQARLDLLKRLRRKYGEDEAAILAFWDRAQRDLDMISDADATEEELAATLAVAVRTLTERASRLTTLRHQGAQLFAADTARHLRDLAMDRAQFSVKIRPIEPSESGADDVEFFFSANLGEDERPLAKIASGGEISRVMLAIKTAMAGRGGIPTLIFDEVDAGLSGRAASAVARKLAELAANYQVLVITHSPQIAAAADHHIRIEKVELNGRVVTRIVPIAEPDRATELARMMTGDLVTEAALTSARELLTVVPAL